MTYPESEYLMLSGIQHFAFCKRQWALIHLEQQWQENLYTQEGQILHENADQPFLKEKERGILSAEASLFHHLIWVLAEFSTLWNLKNRKRESYSQEKRIMESSR